MCSKTGKYILIEVIQKQMCTLVGHSSLHEGLLKTIIEGRVERNTLPVVPRNGVYPIK